MAKKRSEMTPEERERINAGKRAWCNKNKERLNAQTREDRKLNPEKYKKYKQTDYKNNKNNIAKRKKKWQQENADYIREKNRKYREENRERANSWGRKAMNKAKQNPLRKLAITIRTLIHHRLKYKNHLTNSKSTEILGCSITELKLYIEKQFEPWMNWKNGPKRHIVNGPRVWQLDHIIPISHGKTAEEIIKLHHYTNYRPYEGYKNLSDGNRR